MKIGKLLSLIGLLIVSGISSVTSRADVSGSFWQMSKETGKIELLLPGKSSPVVTSVTDSTIFSGTCLDCSLPLDFKSTQAGKSCSVCGCSVNNAACLVGKPIKDGTWQSLLKGLPHGIGLTTSFVDDTKPELGIKKISINLRAVVLSVSGLDSQTADQLLAIAKPIGATKVELLDSGKILSITLKTDYNFEKATKLEKAITAAGGTIAAPKSS